jgi:hypothetical protein
MVCDENGIGDDGEYCGDNDAKLDRINVFKHEAAFRPRTRRDRRFARVAAR